MDSIRDRVFDFVDFLIAQGVDRDEILQHFLKYFSGQEVLDALEDLAVQYDIPFESMQEDWHEETY